MLPMDNEQKAKKKKKKFIPSHIGNKYYWSEKMKSFDRMPYSLSLKSGRKIYNVTCAI